MPSSPGGLPPAVATFLINDCKYSPQVFSRCLLDLTDEGVVRLERHRGDAMTVVTGASVPASGRALRDYERVAVDRLIARDRSGTGVPLSALVTNDGEDFRQFRQQLTDGLGEHARAAGLARRSSGGTWWAVLALAVGWTCVVLVLGGIDLKAAGPALGLGVFVLTMALLLALARWRWRLTPEGAAEADRWRRIRAITAVPAAQGPAASVVMSGGGNTPLPPGQAWSSFGGQWHTVRIGREYQPRMWGIVSNVSQIIIFMVIGTVAFAFFGTIALAAAESPVPAAGGGKFPLSPAEVKLLMFAPATLGLLVIAVCWLPVYLSLLALPTSQTYPGEVVKSWDVANEDYYVSIDDGSAPTTLTFSVGYDLYQQISPGDQVLVTIDPRRRIKRHIEVTAARALAR